MEYKQVLIIREHPPSFEADIKKKSDKKITTWCCVNQGVSEIECKFEKNIFTPNEDCDCIVEIDNDKCNIAMTNVRLAVEQEVHIMCHGHNWRDVITVKQAVEHGVPAKHDKKETKHLKVDLASIKYPAPQHRKKKGAMKPVSLEDAFLMSQAQPAAHGQIIRNEYFLSVRTEFDGCTCCADLPSCKIPLCIVPNVNPACFGF